ncbi:putative E3 ubiquitin-protein ligase LIN-1 isoform X1 [Primulina eburnea]|uniref:putative E3 ubiquitin-protein ligase LIN-1 isoform X1 n=2 Tax=Primulina eburnea TaxID=1245227 RepID=UPI003C6C636A
MAAGATTVLQTVLQHTDAFFAETLSRPELRHHVFSALTSRLPAPLTKSLNFASQTVENAISTTSSSIRSSSLRLAEKLLSSENTAFSSFLLSLVYSLSHRPVDASISLLDVFRADPSLCRREIAPFLFEELFLVHFLPLLEWYNDHRSNILPSNPSFNIDNSGGNYSDDHLSIVSNNTTLLSKMSGDQASALKDLERDYEDLLDQNCRTFVGYFKEVLQNKDGKNVVAPPSIVLRRSNIECRGETAVCSDEEKKMNSQEFGPTYRRYNPMWTEADKSLELNHGTKNLSRFPSLFPERVSPRILTRNQTAEGGDDSNATHDSFTDSEAEIEETIKPTVLFDSRRSQPAQKQKRPFSGEESSRYPSSIMGDVGIHIGGGKHTLPKDFVCPITTHIFDDPVTLETGQTYERSAIQEWLDRGNSTCPITRQTLHTGTVLPKTNYVLKRLIASWKEQNPGSDYSPYGGVRAASEPKFGPSIHFSSPNSVISQATIDATMSELRLAITDLCTSEVLGDSEMAVLRIERCWQEANADSEMMAMLSKPPVINGFVETMFNSADTKVLRSIVFLLTEFGSRDDNVIKTLKRVDSDVECFVELFKKGLSEALVLVHLLKPAAKSLVDMDIVDYLLEVLDDDADDNVPKMYTTAKTAAVILLGQILRSSYEATITEILRSILSAKVIEKVISSLEAERVEEKTAAVSILLRCMLEDGKCRNVISSKAKLAGVLEIFVEVNDDEQFEIVHFLSELVKMNRRNLNEQILHILKEEGTFSTMHSLLTYLQNTPQTQSPIVAGLVLQLDLLDEPRKMSIYREEAMDALISCLRNSESPVTQISAAETVLALQGRFSYSGKSLSRAILLKRAGLDKTYRAFMRRDQRHHNVSADPQDTMEEEKAADDWEKRVAFVLVSHEFGLLFEALAEGLDNTNEDLYSICLMTASWLVHMLSILPDMGIVGAARVCLLKRFVSIFKTQKNTENRVLSMIALNTFIRDPEGLHDLSLHMKDILKGLRELKKSSVMAFEMLKVFSEEHDTSADLWNHQELCQEDCSENGEVLAITCFRGIFFSGHSDGTIKVWANKGSKIQIIQEVREHTKPVTSLAILQSSDKLYSGSLDRTVRVWSVEEDGIHFEQVEEMKDQINSLVVANSMACYIPQGAGVKVHSWNGSSKFLNQNKYAKCLALVQGKLYCGCQDSSIQEIDLVTGTMGNIQNRSKNLIKRAYPIYALEVHDGLIYAAGSSFDGSIVKIWSTSNYNLVGSLASTMEVRTMAVSSELIYLGCKGGTVEVWCKTKYNKVETLQTSSTAKIHCLALDPNQDMLLIGTSDGRIQTWALS